MFRSKLDSIFKKLFKSNLLRSSLDIFRSMILRLLIQGVYFIILARTFAPIKYGAYLGIVAIVSIFIPFASWGSGETIIKDVSRNPTLFRESMGTAILKTIFFGSAFTIAILIVYSFIPVPNVPILAVFFIALANLIFFPLCSVARDAFIGIGLLGYTAKTIVIVSFNRFFAAVIFIVAFNNNPQSQLLNWCILYCIATMAAAAMSHYLIVKHVDYPKFSLATLKDQLKLGFSFAVSVSAQNIYNDLDKSMLLKLSTERNTGIYGAAYHILNVAFTPIQSLALASFRKFFQQGETGIKGSFALCKKILPFSLAYSLLAVAGLALFAPLIPIILGSDYQQASWALIWLSPTIFLRTMHFFAADTLTGANYQSSRTTAQVLVAIFNGILNLLLIPQYGWYGAIWATIASEFMLMVLLWAFVYRYSRQSANLS